MYFQLTNRHSKSAIYYTRKCQILTEFDRTVLDYNSKIFSKPLFCNQCNLEPRFLFFSNVGVHYSALTRVCKFLTVKQAPLPLCEPGSRYGERFSAYREFLLPCSVGWMPSPAHSGLSSSELTF